MSALYMQREKLRRKNTIHSTRGWKTFSEKSQIKKCFRICMQRIRWRDGITDSMNINFGKLWKIIEDRGAWCAAIHGVTKSQTQVPH